MSCVNAVENPVAPPHTKQNPTGRRPDYAWTDLHLPDAQATPLVALLRFYRHAAVVPPVVDHNGYGLRVPALVISPYARKELIDHQVPSFDAYAKFIEDDFLGGQRLDPATDGRPDPRPDVRENAAVLGDLALDFDFSQKPRKPLLLPLHPPFR